MVEHLHGKQEQIGFDSRQWLMTKDREPVYDSEGLRVVVVHDMTDDEEQPTLNAAAREAYEAELAADEEEAKKAAEKAAE